MSRSGKGYEIGRGRPPKATQWKKGKSANPGGRSSPRPTGLLEMIDKLFDVNKDHQRRRVQAGDDTAGHSRAALEQRDRG